MDLDSTQRSSGLSSMQKRGGVDWLSGDLSGDCQEEWWVEGIIDPTKASMVTMARKRSPYTLGLAPLEQAVLQKRQPEH